MILVVGATKGGVGKSTLAINLTILRALTGRDVLLVDGDEQATATSFTELRGEQIGDTGYSTVALRGTGLRTEVRKLSQKYDDVVIDVGGRDTGSLRAALTVADRVLVPVMPRSFDVWAVEQTATLIDEARIVNPDVDVLVVLNCADAQGTDNADAMDAISEIDGLRCSPHMIGRRKAFPNAAAAGRAVIEHRPHDDKAIAEIRALGDVAFVNTTTIASEAE